MRFLDDPCWAQAYIKKRLSNSDLEAIINCTNLAIAPTNHELLQKAQPTSAAAERSFSKLSKLLYREKTENLILTMSKIHAKIFQKQTLANVLFYVYQKIAETVSCISCIWQFFYAQPVVRALFFYVVLSCTAWLHISLH